MPLPLPPAFDDRTPVEQIVGAVVVPMVFGLLTGFALGWNAVVYYILVGPIALAGGFYGGTEHRGADDGVVRGAMSGLVFGSFILLGLEILHEPALRQRADDLVRHLAVLEQQERGDRHHVVLRRDLRVLVGVQLDDAQILALGRELLQMGGDDPARTAPGGPEVHEHRRFGLEHLRLEVVVRYLIQRASHHPLLVPVESL
jgi:hypothetical protein